MIPVLYLVHAGVRRYLGAEETTRLRREAAAPVASSVTP
jgi:hypothetical protein